MRPITNPRAVARSALCEYEWPTHPPASRLGLFARNPMPTSEIPVRRGREFLQLPGPTNIPERVLRAMCRSAIDFNGPEYARIKAECCEGLKAVFKTADLAPIYTASGHGAWEAALVNVCSPGERILMPETGNFSSGWKRMAESFGIVVDYLPGDCRRGLDPAAVEARLAEDRAHAIKAVAVVHTETATGVHNDVAAVRRAMDAARHPALLLVDAIASLAIADFRMDEWGVDVAIAAGQKGLMLPPGMSFTCINEKARAAADASTSYRNYWDWRERLPDRNTITFCGTTPEHQLFGLQESLRMLFEEGLDAVFARHARLAGAVRAAVRAWGGAGGGPELYCLDESRGANAVTTVLMPEGHDPVALRRLCRDRFGVALGMGLRDLAATTFRIGHLGDVNEPMVLGALATAELGFATLGVPHAAGGVLAAVTALAEAAGGEARGRAA